MISDSLKHFSIDYYVNLQRIKKANTVENPELEYQLRIAKSKFVKVTMIYCFYHFVQTIVAQFSLYCFGTLSHFYNLHVIY